ncbi:hypothetical protein BUALT_Bualt13G0015200 [Buddleja alternifolia]|uniref:SWIM-type domain-containing protein n=1 Tax=Buddleja alternifolia TaxID=168488 RepID=A0AAV6WT25_9LAMI|nr:hypothetical protein BUALT_Bualt13G0015200 [Buddleja alternifolia]
MDFPLKDFLPTDLRVNVVGTSCPPIIDINEESLDEVSANLTSKKVLSDNCLSQLESRLDVGQLFSCPNEAYKLYVKYAISKSFSVRKGKNYTFWRSSEIRAKAFLCNKQGESKGKCDKENENKQYHNLDTREKCEAMLYIAREKDAPWKVIKFIKEHTHELAAHDEIHLLKSARKISESKAGTLESMVNAGIKAIHAFNYMEKECGGPEKVEFLKKDVYNLINQIRNSRIAGGDCQQVFNHFQSRVTENSGFYWDADFDQTVVRKWRANEKEEDFRCKNGRPFVVVRNSPLLTQASKVYTYTIYMKFQKELQEGTMGHAIVDLLLEGVSRMYKVMSHGIDKRIRIVVFDKSSEELKCSCKKSECSGILCSHALKVLVHENVTKIPEKCINRRWTKEMKNRIHMSLCGEAIEGRDLEESEMVFVNSTMRYVYEIVMQSKQHLEARKILKDALGNVELQLEDLRTKGLMSYGDEEINTREVNEGNVMHVHDPPVKSKKICNEKHQSHWDIKEKKKKQSNATTSSKDIFFFALSVSLSLIVIIKYKTILLFSGRSKKNVHGSIQLYEPNINVKMVCDASQGSQQSTVAEHFTSSMFQAYTPTPILRLNCDNVSIVQHDKHSQDLTMAMPSGYLPHTGLGLDYRNLHLSNFTKDKRLN